MAEEQSKAQRLKNIAASQRVAPMPMEEGFKPYQEQLPRPAFATPEEERQYLEDAGLGYVAANRETLLQSLATTPTLPKVDLGDIIRRRQAQLGGYSSEEASGMRAQMAAGLARQQQAAQRQLAAQQARSGVRGGAAASQGQQLLQNLGQTRAGAERELFVQNIAEQQRRQKEYEDLRKQEQFAGVAGELARMQMAAAEAQSRRGGRIATDVAAQSSKAARGGLCLFATVTLGSLLGETNHAKAQEIIEKSKAGQIHCLTSQEQAIAQELNLLRLMRDTQCDRRTLRGYYQVSEAIVPLIAGHSNTCKIVRACISKPAIAYMNRPTNLLAKAITKFWLGVAWVVGSEKPFTRSNGEIV